MFDSTDEKLEIRTLSKEEAAVIKANSGLLKPWHVVGWQIVVTAAASLIALLITKELGIAYSLVWGGLCVAVPSALFARGLLSKATLMNAGTAIAGFFLWEMLKIALTFAMLFAATQVIQGLGQELNWPALLVGLVLAMKAYLVAFWCKPKVSK
jgi:ATP synthase protein I